MRSVLVAALAASFSLAPSSGSDVREEPARGLGLDASESLAVASDRSIVVEEATDLPLNPRLAWDSSADPPRPLWFVRDDVSGMATPVWPFFVASAELWKNLAFDKATYPYVVMALKDLTGSAAGGVIRSNASQRDWQEGLSEATWLHTPELAARNVRLAALFEVEVVEQGLDAQAGPTNMLTLEPIEWFRGDPIDGPYFLVVPAISVRVGPFVVVDGRAEILASVENHPLRGASFRPVINVGDRVVVLETRPPVGPPRVLTTLGHAQQNLVVLGADGSVKHSSAFPLALEGSSATEAIVALRTLLAPGGRQSPCQERDCTLDGRPEASKGLAISGSGPVLWSNLAADRAAFVPLGSLRLDDGRVVATELVPALIKERMAERLASHEALLAHEARASQLLQTITGKAVVARGAAYFDHDAHAVTVADPATDAQPLAVASRAAPCAVVVQVERVDYGWRGSSLRPAAAIRGWVRSGGPEPREGCAGPGDTLAVLLPGGWFEWEGVPFHSQMWIGLRRPVAGETVLVLGRPPAEWDASNGVLGLDAERLFIVEDDMVLPQPYADIAEREPVALATALASRTEAEQAPRRR